MPVCEPVFPWCPPPPAGIPGPGRAGPAQGHDPGRLHGAPQGLVLLLVPGAGHPGGEPGVGVQPGPPERHRHPYAGHSQVNTHAHRLWGLGLVLGALQTGENVHITSPSLHCCHVQEHLHLRQPPDQGGDCLLRPHPRREAVCHSVLQHPHLLRLQLCRLNVVEFRLLIRDFFGLFGNPGGIGLYACCFTSGGEIRFDLCLV